MARVNVLCATIYMRTHRGSGTLAIPLHDRVENIAMLVIDPAQVQIVAERNEPEAERALVQHRHYAGQDRIAGRDRDAVMEGTIISLLAFHGRGRE